ncbi:ABC transporter ATP-binding protein [Brenneria tiliae]|uniref:High-affinity branched-chain amino acid transport ATP-binding protein LivG n=1 Tax=Brenneria tiliae TaxID=2914984 RepID=A0ABT0MV58_9GAMM|nr:ATP-binding cassette domain-containing protein [Brenneria tiliae]MCL2893754.1 ATP-binding cassette domain-containing protein [Brenneria tiliae]MCL2899109.1 ATP-binding cassette domain-containing protein [Brenneria tiliae]MCL2903487.1 ATP-binding cassette domain-containing protein [Brenneria tiliae]
MEPAYLLEVSGLGMQFGGIKALTDVNFNVRRNAITALIGPNGAGKTTVFNCVTGFYRPTDGQIWLSTPRGISEVGALMRSILGGTHSVARAGIARTFQNIRLFKEMTVLENLVVAQHQQRNHNLLAGILSTPGYRNAEKRAIATACEWLERVGLLDSAGRLAGELPYGHQRRLEIARAMCTNPTLICLDEPAAGLNPRETAELAALIRRLRDEHGVTVLLIEHDMELVMNICDHIVVLSYGRVIDQGKPDHVANSPVVIEAYLGAPAEDLQREEP